MVWTACSPADPGCGLVAREFPFALGQRRTSPVVVGSVARSASDPRRTPLGLVRRTHRVMPGGQHLFPPREWPFARSRAPSALASLVERACARGLLLCRLDRLSPRHEQAAVAGRGEIRYHVLLAAPRLRRGVVVGTRVSGKPVDGLCRSTTQFTPSGLAARTAPAAFG